MQYHFNPQGFIEEKLHAMHGDTTVSFGHCRAFVFHRLPAAKNQATTSGGGNLTNRINSYIKYRWQHK